MVSEIRITVKDEERSFYKDFLEYETYTVDEKDPIMKSHIDEVLSEFPGEPTDIDIKIKYKVQ